MANRSQPPASSPAESDALAASVDRLADELGVFRRVMDEIREDFSFLARNGLPDQVPRHVHVKRMAVDPCAVDWGERLELECSTDTDSQKPPVVGAVDLVIDDLERTLEAVAQGQLEVIITALDGVRAEILAALKRHGRDPVPIATASVSELPPESSTQPTPPASKRRKPKRPPERLF